MAQQNRTTLKGHFNTGDTPTEAQFADFIDSFHNFSDDDADSIDDTSSSNKFVSQAEKDAIATNTAKVSNATHTGHVTGSTALTIQPSVVELAMLTATGTKDSTTFLRGDNTFAKLGADLTDNSSQEDANGNEMLTYGVDASAVNNLKISNAATGQDVEIEPVGDDTNIDLNLKSKGTGDVLVNGSPISTGGVTSVAGETGVVTATELRTAINVEDGADVTDTANVTAAGALMDSEVTNLAQVKAFDTTDYATAAQGTTADSAMQDVVDDTTPQLGGDLDGQGNKIENFINEVVTSVSGTLTTAAHSGNTVKTSGNITIPTTAGFTATIIAGGAHTVTFNSTTSAAMATGDVMTVVVESATVIHAGLLEVADKVSFS